MFPTIPENLNELSSQELRALARSIKDALVAAFAGTMTAEERTEGLALRTQRDEIIALAAEKDENDRITSELSGDDSDADPQVEVDVTVPTPPPVPAPAPEPDGDEELADTTPVPTGFGVRSTPSGGTRTRLAVDYLIATEEVEGKKPGTTYESWAELAQAAVDLGSSLAPSSERKYKLATIKGNYPAERRLGDGDHMLNVAKFDMDDEMVAAFCAPATPHYDISCMNTLRRPVFNSLPGFEAPRMKVSIMPSPTLSDINAGYGIWEDTDDDDVNARKLCETITCGNPTEYKMYGIWRCLTVKNLLWMSYPELVEAWLNRLGAAHARLAEQTLLEAMAAGITSTVSAPLLGYGASTSITTTIMTYLALYQEQQRWDVTSNFEAWMHRRVLTGIKLDIARRRQTNGGMPTIPTDDQVNTMFRNAGFNPHWFIDTPSWAVASPAIQSGNVLNQIPGSVQVLAAPAGKFALMDKGELSIGVQGNHLYRDNSSNEQNQFTFFWENFEGIVNTNTCPAHILNIPVCWNGAQIDDIVMNCNGGDELGYQS